MSCNECWDIIEKAKVRTIEWAKEDGTPIFRIEYVATFEDWDNEIAVYIFFHCNEEKEVSDKTDFSIKLKQYYLHLLRELKYPFDQFPNVVFIFDSDENVRKNYEGNYFYRLR